MPAGMVAAGRGEDGTLYVLADESAGGLSPQAWAMKAIALWRRLAADCLVAEVKTVALAMAASAPMPDIAARSAQGRALVPVRKGAQQGTAGAAIAAGAAAAQQAHQSGFSAGMVVAIVVAAVIAAIAVWAFWHWRQKQQQEKPV